MRRPLQTYACLLSAATLLLFSNVGHAQDGAVDPRTIDEARTALDALAPDDLKSGSSRLDTVMKKLFSGRGEEMPCNAPGPWISSVSLCEWHAPGKPRDTLPDMFVSVSAAGVDSAVLWGAAPLNKAAWQCEMAEGRRPATICVPRSFSEGRKNVLFREWRVTLAEITRPGDETPAAN